MVLLALALLAFVALAIGYATLPGVGDAEDRVAAVEREHHSRDTRLPLPTRLAAATVAVEDERFYAHGAVDPRAIARAVWVTATSSSDPGGSTITQQLAKALYVRAPESLRGRLTAIGLAAKLEQRYSKQRILEMYLSAIYYGHGYWGAQQASRGYFDVTASRLTWGQASLLAGLPQAPSAYDPIRHYALSRRRQRGVLAQMVSNHILTRTAATAAFRGLRRPHAAP